MAFLGSRQTVSWDSPLLTRATARMIIPARQQWRSFPRTLRSWPTSGDISLGALRFYRPGAGDFLLREYPESAGAAKRQPFLFAYFPSQRSGDAIHCRRIVSGAGWTAGANSDRILVSSLATLLLRRTIPNRTRGEDRQIVLYWTGHI